MAETKIYSERGYTWPMTIKQRDRILYSTSPDMRAVFYEVEMRAAKVLGDDRLFTKAGGGVRK